MVAYRCSKKLSVLTHCDGTSVLGSDGETLSLVTWVVAAVLVSQRSWPTLQHHISSTCIILILLCSLGYFSSAQRKFSSLHELH